VHRHSRLILGVFAGVAIVLLATFAIALAATQRSARDDVADRFHDRAARAAAVTQSLFLVANTIGENELSKNYGAERVSKAQLDAESAADNNLYAALIGPRGELLAATNTTPPAVMSHLRSVPSHIRRAVAGQQIALSDVLTTVIPGTPVIEYATSFKTRFGRRTLVTGLPGQFLGLFLGGLLARGPNAEPAATYILDSNGRIVGAPGVRKGAGTPREPGLLSAYRQRREGTFSSAGSERYLTLAPIPGTPWRIAMSASTERLYASVSGTHILIPWLLFAALVIAAVAAFFLVARLLAADREVEGAYRELSGSHVALEHSNAQLNVRAAELVRSNTDLEQFASIASHDLQEPLRKVQAFGEQLELGWSDQLGEEGQEHVARMRRAASRMQALIDDLLQFARIATDGAQFAPVPLDAVVAAAQSDLELALAETRGEVLVEPLPTVMGDHRQIEQIFCNLLANAIKFRRPDVPPVVHIAARTHDGCAEVSVTDNGIGFEDAYRERIFGIFERLHTREHYPGTGIGLALCRRILERHGGSIEAHGEPNEGTTIVLTLPLATNIADVTEPEDAERVVTVR
jgi:signal transduction histidine kinase